MEDLSLLNVSRSIHLSSARGKKEEETEDKKREEKTIPTIKEFSPGFNYKTSKKLDGLVGGGTTIWWSMRALKGFGICEETFHSTDTTMKEEDYLALPISQEAFKNAYEYREYVYQQFIFYLNKTISKSKTTSSLVLDDIIYDFINKFIPQTLHVEVGGFASNPKKKQKDINIDPFQKLLLFYLNSKKISPIMLDYKIDHQMDLK